MKQILVFIFTCALSTGNLAWAVDGASEHGKHARIRFIGNGLIGLTFHQNKTCVGEKGIEASHNGRKLGAALGIMFRKAKNISLGIPETPNVTNLKNWDVTLSNAFYREYSVNADEPLTIQSAYYFFSESRRGDAIATDTASCGVDGFFVPEDGKDYEVTLNLTGRACHLEVMKIEPAETAVQLVPVKLTMAGKCSARGTGVPELSLKEQKAEDARLVPEGASLRKIADVAKTDIDKNIDEFLARHRVERRLTRGVSAQCPDCPQMIESVDGHPALNGLPQTDDMETNRWIKLIEPELNRYLTNQASYFNLPSNVVEIPCEGADDDLRKAAEFVSLSEKPLEQRQAYERNIGAKADYYFRDVRLWPVKASCVNGKLNGEVDLWIFGNKVYDDARSIAVAPNLAHVRFTAVNGKPIGLMNFAIRSQNTAVVEYKDAKIGSLWRYERATFKYQEAGNSENPRSVTVTNTINGTKGFNNIFDGPNTSVELPISPSRTEAITFDGLRKSARFMYKDGILHGETIFYGKPKLGISMFSSATTIPVTKKCYKDGVLVDVNPCNVE